MNEKAFVDARYDDWMSLSRLCDRADRSITDLSPEDLQLFINLYRRISSDLALVRTRSNNAGLIEFLNDLGARAYSILYRRPRQPLLPALVSAAGIAAQTVRRRILFVLASLAIFLGSGVGAFVAVDQNRAVQSILVPPMMQAELDAWKSGHFPERTGSESAGMTTFYASNNPRVAIMAGALGAASFGLISVILLASNGALLGVLIHELAPLGKVDFLLSSIAPHGVPEISGAILAGAAGLILGYALINPGRMSRSDSLRFHGKDAMTLLATSVTLMFIAAPIEGFFSYSPHVRGWFKSLFALASLVAWLVFWRQFGLPEETDDWKQIRK